eukprot:5006017-Heterocapsa_arctica.AAC.1
MKDSNQKRDTNVHYDGLYDMHRVIAHREKEVSKLKTDMGYFELCINGKVQPDTVFKEEIAISQCLDEATRLIVTVAPNRKSDIDVITLIIESHACSTT